MILLTRNSTIGWQQIFLNLALSFANNSLKNAVVLSGHGALFSPWQFLSPWKSISYFQGQGNNSFLDFSCIPWRVVGI